MKLRHAQQGLNLIELMISMVLGLILVAGVITLFLQTRNSLSQDEKQAQMSDSARFAMALITNDLLMTGFWGNMAEGLSVSAAPQLLGTAAVTGDCGPVSLAIDAADPAWLFDFNQALDQFDNDDADQTVSSKFKCLASSSVLDDTDVLMIKRVHGGPIASAGVPHKIGRVYLRSNANAGTLYVYDDEPASPAAGSGVNDWTYQPVLYFIRSYSQTAGDGIPSLCQKHLQAGSSGTPQFVSRCIADGIEDLQLEFGIDNDGDGTVDYFDPDPDAAALKLAASVRVYMLARSREEQFDYDNKVTYHLGSKEYTPDDRYMRRLYTSTVQLRNLIRQRAL